MLSQVAEGGSIPHEIMLARLEQSESMREFFFQMWLQNPDLAKHAGKRIIGLLAPLDAVPPAPTFPQPKVTP